MQIDTPWPAQKPTMENYVWRILLVDDDEEDYFLTREMLSSIRRGKYILEWCANLEVGLQSLQNNDYDVVLVDYDLGMYTGIEFIRKAVNAGCNIPILMVTGRGNYEVDLEAMQAGAEDYLSKGDLNPALLERAIRYAIERKRSERALAEANLQLNQANKELKEARKSAEKAAANAQHAAREARASSIRMEAIINNLTDVVIVIDKDDHILLANSFAIAMLGFDPSRMTQAAVFSKVSVTGEDGKPVALETMPASRARNNEVVLNFPVILSNLRGRVYHILTSAMPLYIGHEYIGVVTVWNDITEAWQAEISLRESEERFRVALQNTPISVFSMDNALRYTWIYHPQLGFTPEQAIGKRDDELISDGKAAELVALHQSVISEGTRVNQEIQLQVQDDPKQFILSTEPLRNADGAITGLIGMMMDVTRQRQLEAQQMEFRTQMEVQHRLIEHRERERQEIARDLHDGPIQSIVGALFTIQTEKDAVTDEASKKILDEIAGGLRGVVAELRGMVNTLRPPVLLRYGLSRAIQIHTEDVRARHAELKIDLDLVEDENLLSEDTCLALYRIYQEAMNNILRHARASMVWVRYYPSGSRMVLEIKDNGVGFTLPADWIDLTRDNHFGVVGMKERIEALGGSLNVIAAPEQGTHLRFLVPIKKA